MTLLKEKGNSTFIIEYSLQSIVDLEYIIDLSSNGGDKSWYNISTRQNTSYYQT
ncbi:MAG: hypothetical protein ACOWWH_11355 [Eubacteriaceae bacterium]